MPSSTFTILKELETILKEDPRTREYNVGVLTTPDGPPTDHNICPSVDIHPRLKGRVETRIGTLPHTELPLFEITMWESSLTDLEDAFERLDTVEENVYAVLKDNRQVRGKVSASSIGDTSYDFYTYETSFFVSGTITFTIHQPA